MRRLSALTAAMLAASGATAGGMIVNSPQINSMGGAGVASSSALNPAMITPIRGEYDFDLTIGSGTLFLEDPNGFAFNLQQFLDEDLETYQDFDYGQLNTSASNLADAAGDTADAANNFDETDSSTLDDLRAAQQNQTAATNETQGSVGNYRGLVESTEKTFRAFSDRPVNFGLLAGLGLTMPRGDVPFAIALSNNTYGGARLNLQESDLQNLNFVLDDLDDYLEAVEELNQRLETLVDAAEAFEAAPNDAGAQSAFEDARDDFDAQRAVVESFNSENELFVGGEVDDDADILTFDEEDLDSTIDLLGANITELAFGSGMDFPNVYGNLSVGATAKIQYIQVFGDVIAFDDADSVDASFINENTNEYVAVNLDIGVAQSFQQPGLGMFSVGAVVKDLIPQSFESGDGRDIDIGPKVRAGVSHQTRLTRVTMDIDLTENDPIGFGVPTRYFGIGGEFNAWDWARFRAGYRNNLAVDDASIITAGIGLTPWVTQLEFSGWYKPNSEDEVDLLLNTGFSADFAVRF
ncbi:MAG: conjugal transfer protein TraF [Natronospirillum sp.]|uniref:conjugal transfer protein TraF n=1 Tax=Natronospirillum sp. TaxID=2812955 RepID=UPI0025FDCF0E|nr:conjugal transfer protein TraF [Natronospirillum sp.]MCH8551261.1 conjugal transfer protein TraF [Natronospirillum sp.]